jgi:hypothetical protein
VVVAPRERALDRFDECSEEFANDECTDDRALDRTDDRADTPCVGDQAFEVSRRRLVNDSQF